MCPKSPKGRPYPSAAQAGPEGLGCNRRCVGEGPFRVPTKPPRGVPIHPRPRQDWRDSGVTAAVWGRDLSVCPQTPTGRPYPSAAQARPEGLGCNRRCVGGGPLRVPPEPNGGSLSLRGPARAWRDSGVTAAVWGRDLSVCPKSPTGRPYPSMAQAGPEGLGCNRRCVGGDLSVCPQTPTGRPYPSAAKAGPEGLGCNRRCVGEGPLRVPTIPHGASLSLHGPGRTGGTRVCPPPCGGGRLRVPPKPPRGVPIPLRPRQDRRDSGVTAAVWGRSVSCARNPLRGVTIPPRPCVVGGETVCPPIPTGRPHLHASHAGPGGPGCHSPRGGSGGRGNYQSLSVPDRNQETPTCSPCGRSGGPPVPWPVGGVGGG